jgi:hypothetical protein
MRRILCLVLVCVALSAGGTLRGQGAHPPQDDVAMNAKKARVVLDAMVQALGGQPWLDMKNREQHGHVAAFYHGNPDPGTTEVFEFHSWPDHDRMDVTKHRDYLQFFIGREGWEVTYRGKKQIPEEQLNEYLRRRDHSIEMAVKVWLKDPNTILLYEGQHLAERHLAEQVTLISPSNEAITISCDVQTHLPLKRSFEWRDPVYKDKNTDTEEYDDYHPVQGFPTPYTITRWKNDEMVRQFFIDRVAYNENLDADFWSVDAATARIKKTKN